MEEHETHPVPASAMSLSAAATAAPAPVPGGPGPASLPPAPSAGGLLGRLTIAEWLLKHRDHLYEQIDSGEGLKSILVDLLLVAGVFTALYGLVVGMATGSWARILSNPLKLPMVLVNTTLLCLPTLYIFSSFLGSRRSFLQTATLTATSIAIIGVILVGFAPITWFLTFTSPQAYALHVAVNVAVLGLAGAVGVHFLMRGLHRVNNGGAPTGEQKLFFWAWTFLYGMVGSQMGYLFAPFFSTSDEWFRTVNPGDSVFAAIGGVLRQLLFGH